LTLLRGKWKTQAEVVRCYLGVPAKSENVHDKSHKMIYKANQIPDSRPKRAKARFLYWNLWQEQ